MWVCHSTACATRCVVGHAWRGHRVWEMCGVITVARVRCDHGGVRGGACTGAAGAILCAAGTEDVVTVAWAYVV